MVITQSRSEKKSSGGKYKSSNPKKKHQTGSKPTLTKIDEGRKLKKVKTRGGETKTRQLSAEEVNLLDPESGEHEKIKIKSVVKNPANTHYARRNLLTKGTIIKTEEGEARITNRPGQEAVVNAVLIE